MRYVVAALAALVASAAPVAAQSTGSANGEVAKSLSPGRILGIFDVETSNPIEGAEVIDRIANASAVTGKSGLVGLGSFKSQHDSSVVTVRKIGYQDTTFLVLQSDTTPITLMLEQAAPVLPAMLTEAMKDNSFKFLSRNMQDFMSVAMDKSHHGIVIGPADMRSVAFGDGRLLAMQLAGRGARSVTSLCRGGTVDYLDGAYVGRGLPDGTNLAAAVYYSATDAPARYKGPIPSNGMSHPEDVGGCGVLLLWRRESAGAGP